MEELRGDIINMKLCFNELLLAISYALDCVERDLVGVSTNHSKRVAYLCVQMGKKLGLEEKKLSDLLACAILHDNALTEYIQAEYLSTGENVKVVGNRKLGIHCTLGERNVNNFPFFGDTKNAILYHHENADGSGPFGKKKGEIPIYASLIHIADILDASFHLRCIDDKKYEKLLQYIDKKRGILFSEKEADLFLSCFDKEDLKQLGDNNIDKLLKESILYFENDYKTDQIICISSIFARIIDYKSTFTSLHSIGIAHKAFELGSYYQYDEETKAKLFLAGALHDVGKLAIDVDILEKPGKLTEEEFEQIKNHARVTYEILSQVHGFEEITNWASLHHEKLNGKGYPFGYHANQLDFFARLMGCIDIYQALREDRPYKKGMSHMESMKIMCKMAQDGFIDETIVADIEKAFCY